MNIEATISGNAFQGVATWGDHEQEYPIRGHFFGPDGKELGGVFRAVYYVEEPQEWRTGVVAFVASQVAE